MLDVQVVCLASGKLSLGSVLKDAYFFLKLTVHLDSFDRYVSLSLLA